jgi:hypothetical protein
VSVLGNGDPLFMDHYQMIPAPGSKVHYSVSHRAHLEPSFHKRYTSITSDFEVVLFHYVTRSQNNFVENKINRRSGVYATTYAELQEKDSTAGEPLFLWLQS